MNPAAMNGVKVMTTLLSPEPDKAGELVQTLQILSREIRNQLGCLECVVSQEIDGGQQFVLVTAWKDISALRMHLVSEPFQVLVGAARLLGAPTEFRYATSDSVYVSAQF
jgi:quinol monooxygenase YgiN